MSYESYFQKLKIIQEKQDLKLQQLILKAIEIYQGQDSWLRNKSMRAIDLIVMKTLTQLESPLELIKAIESYFIGYYSANKLLQKYLKNKVEKATLLELQESITKQCAANQCHKKLKSKHQFRKGTTHNSELEEVIIAAINVYRQQKAYQQFLSLKPKQKNTVMLFIAELTQLDLSVLSPKDCLAQKQYEQLKKAISVSGDKWYQAVQKQSRYYQRIFLANYEQVSRGLTPGFGEIKKFQVSYQDKAIAKKIVFNMLIKAMIDKPKSLAWINRYEGVIDSFWPDLKKFLKLDASQEKIFENYLTVYQKEKAREITFKLFGNQKDPKHIVIALHGWMHSAEAWYPLIMQARLEKQDCLIISYDQFGFGHDENRHSDRIDIGKMIVDIENVTKYFRKTYPDAAIHLVGHSMSGAMLGIFANYNKQQNLVQSYHALAPAIAACRKNIFDLRKAKCKIDFLETMWYIGMSPSTKINAKKYSLAIITNIPAIIELMLYAYRNYLALLETVKVPFYMSACGRDICVNIKDFELLHQSLSKEQQSEQMHYRFFPEAYHLPAQSREKEFVNSMLIEDLSSHEHKSI